MNRDNIKILIVEDEVLIAMHLAGQLKQAGYTVCRPVTNGAAAIAAAGQEHPSVILLDIRLPGEMDGIEAGRAITDRYNIPVIFVTGYSDSAIESRARNITTAKVLGKPASVGEIDRAIAQVLC